MIQFYTPDIETTGQMPEEEAGHALRVLRMKKGDELVSTDGLGHRFRSRIAAASKKGVTLEILEREEIPNHWPCRIEICIAPTKNADRIEWFLEKAVEIGVDRVTLLNTAHSERKKINTDRLEKILVSAMKQSLKTVKPELVGPVKFADMLKEPFDGESYMGYCSEDVERVPLACRYETGTAARILIGPEGDFSPDEAQAALEAGFVPVTFGDSRLRTETAGLFALQTVHIINQRMHCYMQEVMKL